MKFEVDIDDAEIEKLARAGAASSLTNRDGAARKAITRKAEETLQQVITEENLREIVKKAFDNVVDEIVHEAINGRIRQLTRMLVQQEFVKLQAAGEIAKLAAQKET